LGIALADVSGKGTAAALYGAVRSESCEPGTAELQPVGNVGGQMNQIVGEQKLRAVHDGVLWDVAKSARAKRCVLQCGIAAAPI